MLHWQLNESLKYFFFFKIFFLKTSQERKTRRYLTKAQAHLTTLSKLFSLFLKYHNN